MTIPNINKKLQNLVKDSEITMKAEFNTRIKKIERKVKSQPSMLSLYSQRTNNRIDQNKSTEKKNDLGPIKE